MNGLNSFYTLEDGLKHMIGHGLWTRGKKVALFQVDSSNLYALENGECKVTISCGRVVRDFEREAKTRCNF